MTKFAESTQISKNPEEVFDFTQDYNKRLLCDTFLKKAELINATVAASGVKAYCVAHNGLGMETEYVSFRRAAVTAIKMTKGPYLFNFSWVHGTSSKYKTAQQKLFFFTRLNCVFPLICLMPSLNTSFKKISVSG